MPPIPPLFTIPITPLDAHPGGTIVCTVPRPAVYLLTFTSPPDNRLTAPFCRALLRALDALEQGSHAPGVVVTTSGISKFYSNGLDLAHATSTPGYWALLYSVWRRFLTFPMPTVALLNGHTFAGGLMLAICHDYRLAPSPRGFLCLNELLFGAHLKPAMAALFRYKINDPGVYRSLVLEARRFDGKAALEAGLVDVVIDYASGGQDAGWGAVCKLIDERDLTSKAKTGVYGVLKAEMYKDLIRYLASPTMEEEEVRWEKGQAEEEERKKEAKQWYEAWSKDKAKL